MEEEVEEEVEEVEVEMEEEMEEEEVEEEEEKEEEEEEEKEEDNQGADEEKMTMIVHKNTHLHTQHKMSIQAMGISRLMNNAH